MTKYITGLSGLTDAIVDVTGRQLEKRERGHIQGLTITTAAHHLYSV